MYKVIMTFLLFVIWTSTSYAKDLLFLSNGATTGMLVQLSRFFASDLEKDGYLPQIKSTNNNCALAKLMWDQSRVPTLMLTSHYGDGLTDINNKMCFVSIKQEELLYWVYSTPYVFCSAGNKTWQDLLIPNSTHTIAIPHENRSLRLLEEISKFYNIKIKPVKVESSVHLIPMIKSGELDFVFRTGITEFEDLKNKCIWTTKNENYQKLPNGSKYLSKLNIDLSVFSLNSYIVGKNISTQDKEKILKAIQNGWKSEEVQKIFTRRNFDSNLVSFQNKQEYDDKIKYLWNLIYQ